MKITLFTPDEFFFGGWGGGGVGGRNLVSIDKNAIKLDEEGTYLANRSLGVSFMSSSRTCFITLRGQSFLLDRSVIPC